MSTTPRWFADHPPGHSSRYVERFRALAADGADLAGEARLVDALVAPGSRILDAGCGTGRVAGALAARGHDVVGVDVDDELVAAAEKDHRGPRWLVADLTDLDLCAHGMADPFDAALLAGNVLLFVAPGTESAVLARVAAHVRPDGLVVVGFGLERGYALPDLDAHAEGAGLVMEHRFATWDLRPFADDATFAVSVFRRIP